MSTELSFKRVEKELTVSKDGIGFVSMRGLARLAGVDLFSVQTWYSNLGDQQKQENEEKSMGLLTNKNQVFISDVLAFEYIDRRVEAGNKVAIQTFRIFARIGLRVAIQQSLGWQPPTPTPALPKLSQPLLESMQSYRVNIPARCNELREMEKAGLVTIHTHRRNYYTYHLTELGIEAGYRVNKNGTILNPTEGQ